MLVNGGRHMVTYPTISGTFVQTTKRTWDGITGGAYAVGKFNIPAGDDFVYYAQYNGITNQNCALGISDNSALEQNNHFDLGILPFSVGGFYRYIDGDGGVPTDSAITATAGDLWGIRRRGTVYTFEYFRAGVWGIMFTAAASAVVGTSPIVYPKAEIIFASTFLAFPSISK